jgi:hypothetical protein
MYYSENVSYSTGRFIYPRADPAVASICACGQSSLRPISRARKSDDVDF